MSHPFEYFDPAVAAKSHQSKVDISPSPPAGASGAAPGASKPSPYHIPSSGAGPNPYKPSGANAPGNVPQQYVAPKPSHQAPAGRNPYAPVAPSGGHGPYGAAKPVSAPTSKPSGNPYAVQQQAAGGASRNPYALPHQPSAPQGGFQGPPAKAYPGNAKPSPSPVSAAKGPYSAPAAAHAQGGLPASAAPQPRPPMKFAEGPELFLQDSDRQQFLDCGFVLLPNIVSQELRTKALHAINKSLGRIPITNRNTTSCPELVSAEPLLNLFHASGCASLTSKLLAPGFYPPPLCFINLQYPGDGCVDEQQPTDPEGWHLMPEREPSPLPHWQSYWKIDGLPAPANGPNDENHFVRNYSLLVAVFLSDVDLDNHGNVTLWPGSHLGIQAMLRARGGALAALNSGKIDRPVIHNNQLESVPQQLSVKAGDVLLCHYQVAHTHAPNLGPDIRYVVYFRVYSHQHTPNSMRAEAMDNVFLDFEGLYDLIGQSHPK